MCTKQVYEGHSTTITPSTPSAIVQRHRKHHHHRLNHAHNHTAHHREHRKQRRRLRLLEKLLNETHCGERLKCLDRKIDRLMGKQAQRLEPNKERKRSHQHRHHHRQECDLCPPGYYMLSMCRPESDTKCASCPRGTFQEHNNVASSCEKCSLCGQSLYESHPCTSTSDTICDSCFTKRSSYSYDYHVKCLDQRPASFSN